MGQPFVGEIRMFGGSFAPAGWAMCNGQTLAISQNETLFNLIGTTYGGDGQSTFDLPNLSGRVPLHSGTNAGVTFQIGEAAGVEQVTLTTQQIPQHNHAFICSTAQATDAAAGQNVIPGSSIQVKIYTPSPAAANMNAGSLQPQGGSQPHENMMPFLVVTFIISLFGIFPSPN
jgi:microcystin-dependent protein